MKKKLALIFTNGNGLWTWENVGTLSRELAIYKELSENGWEVSFYTYDRSANLPCIGFNADVITQRPYLLPRRLSFMYEVLMPFLHYLRGSRNVFVVTNQAHSGWPAIIAGKLWNARVIARCGYVFGEQAEVERFKGWRVSRKMATERWTFRNADVCVVPTIELSQWVVAHYGIKEDKIRVIPNFVDTRKFCPNPQAKKDIDVLCVGRLHEVKRLKLVISAVADAERRKIMFVGQGTLANDLKAQAHEKGLSLDILPRVPNEQLPELYNRAHIYIIASKWEGHPKSLLEAMACGCACIGVDSPGIRNLITNGINGRLVNAQSADIAVAIRELIEDATSAVTIRNNARSYIEKNYSLANVYHKYAQLLSEFELRRI